MVVHKKEAVHKGKDIKFILDRTKKEQEELIAKIFDVVKKKPYPTKQTTQLATFVHALFQTAPYVKRPRLKKKIEEERLKEEVSKMLPAKEVLKPMAKPLPVAPKPHREVVEEGPLPLKIPEPPKEPKLELPKLTPLPKTETEEKPEMKKREYVVNLFNTPVGVLVAPDKKTFKVTYHIVEPVFDQNVLQRLKEYIKKDFKKDYKVLDKDDVIKEHLEKACKKAKVKFTDDLIKKAKYYLKRDLTGFRRIDPLMQDPHVKAIYVSGVNQPVVVEFEDFAEKIQSNVIFTDLQDLNVLITKLARVTNNEITDEKPILDTVFQGFKIQATKGVGGAASKLIIKKVML